MMNLFKSEKGKLGLGDICSWSQRFLRSSSPVPVQILATAQRRERAWPLISRHSDLHPSPLMISWVNLGSFLFSKVGLTILTSSYCPPHLPPPFLFVDLVCPLENWTLSCLRAFVFAATSAWNFFFFFFNLNLFVTNSFASFRAQLKCYLLRKSFPDLPISPSLSLSVYLEFLKKCAIQWFLVYSQSWGHITTI